MAVGIATVGLMGAFALVFVPAWLAFRVAPGWRASLVIAAGFAACPYLAAFVLALALDQPFGPVLVGVLLGGGALGTLARPNTTLRANGEAPPARPRGAADRVL